MSDPISKKPKTEATNWYGATKKEAKKEQDDSDKSGVRKKGW